MECFGEIQPKKCEATAQLRSGEVHFFRLDITVSFAPKLRDRRGSLAHSKRLARPMLEANQYVAAFTALTRDKRSSFAVHTPGE